MTVANGNFAPEPGQSSKPQNRDVPENSRRTGTDLEITPGGTVDAPLGMETIYTGGTDR